MIVTSEMVKTMKPGDYVEAEFRELERPEIHWRDGYAQLGFSKPTGRTYTLSGVLSEYSDHQDPDMKGLGMPNGQSVRQTGGLPGGNLVRIIKHIPKADVS